jgi:hypothetical protein
MDSAQQAAAAGAALKRIQDIVVEAFRVRQLQQRELLQLM